MAKGNALPIILLGGGALLLATMGGKQKSKRAPANGGTQGYKTPSGKDGNVKDVPVYIGITPADADYFKDLIVKNYDNAIVLIYDPAKQTVGSLNSIVSQFATQNRDVAFLIAPCTYPDDISCDMTIYVGAGGRLSNGDFSVENFASNVSPEELPGVIEDVFEAFGRESGQSSNGPVFQGSAPNLSIVTTESQLAQATEKTRSKLQEGRAAVMIGYHPDQLSDFDPTLMLADTANGFPTIDFYFTDCRLAPERNECVGAVSVRGIAPVFDDGGNLVDYNTYGPELNASMRSAIGIATDIASQLS